MKRISILATLALSASLAAAVPPAFAQASTDPAAQQQQAPAQHVANPHKQAMRMSRELNLSPDQTAKVEPILAQRDQQIASIRANTQLSPDQMHQQLHQVAKSSRDQLAGVLTPDQMTQMKAMHHHSNPNMPAAPPTV